MLTAIFFVLSIRAVSIPVTDFVLGNTGCVAAAEKIACFTRGWPLGRCG